MQARLAVVINAIYKTATETGVGKHEEKTEEGLAGNARSLRLTAPS